MNSPKMQKLIVSSIGIIIAILLFFSSNLKIPVLDPLTDDYFTEAITKAGLAYATCRVINASVSIVKDSSLQLQPAGVGVSLAVGQALDPIDDMTERLSDVLVTAITSLGVQKIAYEISVLIAPGILSVLIFILSILVWFDYGRINFLRKTLTLFMFLIISARFCLPLASIADDYLHKHFFADQISEATKKLAISSTEIEKLKDFSMPEIDGVLNSLKNSASFIKQKSIEFKNALAVTVDNAGDIIENLLKLTFLYVGIFVIQVIILPLLSFLFLVKMANTLFQKNIPVILHHSDH